MKRLTLQELRDEFPDGKYRPLFFDANTQVFDFGQIDHVEVDRSLTAELWHRKLLRTPFEKVVYTFKRQHVRIYLIIAYGIMIEQHSRMEDDCTALIVMSQSERGLRADAVSWFKIPDGENVLCGSRSLSSCDGETDESFKEYTLACLSHVMTLSMLLNTKGVPKRTECYGPESPINVKRARSGKPPLSTVTYVDLSKIAMAGHASGGGGTKSMHLRRGHLRHYDDGSVTWVRDTIVKADGDLKMRERYQIKGEKL